MQTYAYNR